MQPPHLSPPLNFYPRSPRGERRLVSLRFPHPLEISIHAPREGSDLVSLRFPHPLEISIHAPREGSDALFCITEVSPFAFLSTLPARGATTACLSAPMRAFDFYPRSPRGERRVEYRDSAHRRAISIHAPREGSDHRPHYHMLVYGLFLSTLPARGAT